LVPICVFVLAEPVAFGVFLKPLLVAAIFVLLDYQISENVVFKGCHQVVRVFVGIEPLECALAVLLVSFVVSDLKDFDSVVFVVVQVLAGPVFLPFVELADVELQVGFTLEDAPAVLLPESVHLAQLEAVPQLLVVQTVVRHDGGLVLYGLQGPVSQARSGYLQVHEGQTLQNARPDQVVQLIQIEV